MWLFSMAVLSTVSLTPYFMDVGKALAQKALWLALPHGSEPQSVYYSSLTGSQRLTPEILGITPAILCIKSRYSSTMPNLSTNPLKIPDCGAILYYRSKKKKPGIPFEWDKAVLKLSL